MGAERAEARQLPGGVAGHPDGAERPAVIAPAHGENLGGLARRERGEQRGLVGFGAGVVAVGTQ